jgi:hypothetical protein
VNSTFFSIQRLNFSNTNLEVDNMKGQKRQGHQSTLQSFINKIKLRKVESLALPRFTGFTVVGTPADGACMFTALVHQVNSLSTLYPQLAANDLRRILVDYIRNHPSIISESGSVPEGW